jgi:hypothetical protein
VTVSEDLLAGLVMGALVVAALAVVAVKAAKTYRKTRVTVRRWSRTRLVLTQAPRRRARSRARR